VTSEGVLLEMSVKPGDIVRFSELEYPTESSDGHKHVLISEQDILWVEEAEEA
jgi:co-chaperonin GroES (HSP10)